MPATTAATRRAATRRAATPRAATPRPPTPRPPTRRAPTLRGPTLRAPLQERSRRTLERLLLATEKLLARRAFEAISVEEIVGAARTSVGAFYARFASKEALLPALYARYDAALDARLAAAEERRPDGRLADVAEWIAREFLRTYRDQPHLMRALALFVRAHPEAVDAATRDRRRAQHEVFVRALLAHRVRIRHADPERAVARALYFAVAALRDTLLFGASTHAAALRLDDEELVRETARLVVAYLTWRDTGP